MINDNYRLLGSVSSHLSERDGADIHPGDAVRRSAAMRYYGGETGIVVERGPRRTTVRWTSGETTSVPNCDVRLLGRGR